MANKLFVVDLTGGAPGDPAYVQSVRAERVQEDGEYLYFIQADGTVGGLFLKSTVKSWHEEPSDWTGQGSPAS